MALSENRMATAPAAPNAGVCAAGAPNADGVLNPPANPPKVIFLSNERAGVTVSQTSGAKVLDGTQFAPDDLGLDPCC